MKFTQDWFTHNIPNFENIKKELMVVERILEIGCFEGRATCWMLENMLAEDGTIHVIDTFEGGEEHGGLDLNHLEETFYNNVEAVKKVTQNLTTWKGESYKEMAGLIQSHYKKYFDFIYIDGSHTAPDVLTDACMAFGLLKPGGIMLFDDYMWADSPSLLHRPKIAIDMFTLVFAEKATIRMVGYQLAIQKAMN